MRSNLSRLETIIIWQGRNLLNSVRTTIQRLATSITSKRMECIDPQFHMQFLCQPQATVRSAIKRCGNTPIPHHKSGGYLHFPQAEVRLWIEYRQCLLCPRRLCRGVIPLQRYHPPQHGHLLLIRLVLSYAGQSTISHPLRLR